MEFGKFLSILSLESGTVIQKKLFWKYFLSNLTLITSQNNETSLTSKQLTLSSRYSGHFSTFKKECRRWVCILVLYISFSHCLLEFVWTGEHRLRIELPQIAACHILITFKIINKINHSRVILIVIVHKKYNVFWLLSNRGFVFRQRHES